MELLTRTIIDLEWAMFTQVENEGGRAACQNDRATFAIMRGAQLEAWDAPLRESYRDDLLEARRQGRNLPAEKYARMMAKTAPDQYAQLAPRLPSLAPQVPALIDKIAALQMAWAREAAARYPAIAAGGRPLESAQDGQDTTSAETYLRGELATYSPKTLALYLDYCLRLAGEGTNLCTQIWENTAKAYGYASLEAAETALQTQKTPGP